MTDGLNSAKSTLRLKNHGMCRADYEWRLHLDKMKVGEMVEEGPLQVGSFQWMLVAHLRCRAIDNRTVLQLFAVSLNATPAYARLKFYADCGNEAASSQGTSRTVCPYGCLANTKLLVDLVNRHEGGPPVGDGLKVNFSLKGARLATNAETNEISTSMTPVKVEVFGRKAVEDWLDHHTYGILPETSEREKLYVWHGSLIRYWAKSHPEYRYWTFDRAHHGDLFLKQCLNDAEPLKSFGDKDVSQAVEGKGLLTQLFEETRSHGKDFESIPLDAKLLHVKLSEPPYCDPTYIGHFFVQDTTMLYDLMKTATELAIGDEVPHKVLAEAGSLRVKDLTNLQASVQECEWLHSGSVIVVKLLALKDAFEACPHRPQAHMIEE